MCVYMARRHPPGTAVRDGPLKRAAGPGASAAASGPLPSRVVQAASSSAVSALDESAQRNGAGAGRHVSSRAGPGGRTTTVPVTSYVARLARAPWHPGRHANLNPAVGGQLHRPAVRGPGPGRSRPWKGLRAETRRAPGIDIGAGEGAAAAAGAEPASGPPAARRAARAQRSGTTSSSGQILHGPSSSP